MKVFLLSFAGAFLAGTVVLWGRVLWLRMRCFGCRGWLNPVPHQVRCDVCRVEHTRYWTPGW